MKKSINSVLDVLIKHKDSFPLAMWATNRKDYLLEIIPVFSTAIRDMLSVNSLKSEWDIYMYWCHWQKAKTKNIVLG